MKLYGCNHEGEKQESSPLLGKWITNACEKDMSVAIDGRRPIGWNKGVYDFSVDGEIIKNLRVFSDSSCSGDFVLVQPSEWFAQDLGYSDIGNELLEEGLEGGRIKIIIPAEDPPYSAEGFYTINNGSLCFSDNLNFNATFFTTSEAELLSIDFQKCLSKL